jgi:hypothetical protein
LVYRIAMTMFGGFGPFVVMSLTEASGSPLPPTYHLMYGLAASIAAVACMPRHRHVDVAARATQTGLSRAPFTPHPTA